MESFQHILDTTLPVHTFADATSDVSDPSIKIPVKIVFTILLRGAFSHLLPLFICTTSIFSFYNIILATQLWYVGGEKNIQFRVAMFETFTHSSIICLQFVQDHPVLDLFLLFILGFSVIVYQLFKRLYLWSTNEYKHAPNIKDSPEYQDPALLKKAWARAESVGWTAPLEPDDEKKSLNDFHSLKGCSNSGGSVVFQPRSGWCGIASLTSTLRSFPSTTQHKSKHNKDTHIPYLKMHKVGRYLELVQARDILQKIAIDVPEGKQQTLWEEAGGGKVASIEIVGGGAHGFPSYAAFLHVLRQINHPTQPARCVAIYGRSPLFFCGDNKLSTKLSSFFMGHWSPLPAYLEEENLVLNMDVNRDYGARGYLVPPRRLYESINTKCCMNGAFRGLIILRPPPLPLSLSLLSRPQNISRKFFAIKKDYYKHVATSALASSNQQHIQWQEKGPLSLVISTHPFSFTNCVFIDEKQQHTLTLEQIQDARDIFTENVCPMRMTVRCATNSEFERLRQLCQAAGLVLFMKQTAIWKLDLLSSSTRKIMYNAPKGYTLEEINTNDSDTIQQWGNVVAESYGFPQVKRDGMTPGDHFGLAYANTIHGKHLRQFVLRQDEKNRTENVVACSTLFVDEHFDFGCMFNVCCLKDHQKKGIGKFMSNVVIYKATEMGCVQLLLEASPKGEPVYKKLGFQKMIDEHSGTFLSLSISTKSCRWKCLWLIVEFVLGWKFWMFRFAITLMVVAVAYLLKLFLY
jgi:N-acetylglutamate synthase-like GNAT family acetyltransferase